ncbi:hypothetical protein [Flavihumibacter petaseus]|uniref:Uncharacterized protein n=1 Tax=Flavihumibacter petaseus NBRC 106054 TaxID=1220578 RepID=A0A0E9N5N7_9BACT|nr:hypothetical protein [Flavihumibacter petaseus]GAO45118.1 hypothetical protein FPE01S_04_03610 [Flavihumibacter petaseus NBRC 106054]
MFKSISNRTWLLTISASFSVILYACGQGKSSQPAPDVEFVPITAYIREELKSIDSLKLPTTLYYQDKDRKDTSAIPFATCDSLARAGFLAEDITREPLKSSYKESSFADQSIPNVTFTYLTSDSTLPLKRADVILKPDPAGLDKVNTIYLEKLYQSGDTLIQDKLFWKANHYYQILRSRQIGQGEATVTQWKVVWDPVE